MNKILVLISFILCSVSFAQTDSMNFTWKTGVKYIIGENEVWSVDGLDNVYLSKKGLIEKYDSVGTLKFSQSIKSLGRMTQLVPINTMKLVHFSEEQQTLCYFDNTLSSMDDCIDLAEEGLINAILISRSGQPNKLWVLDNANSRLMLLSQTGMDQAQEVVNLRGVLEIENVTQILERNNQLYLLDPQNGVYIFDLYGSLIEFVEKESIQQLDANERTLFTLQDNRLNIRALKTGETFAIDLPIDGVFEFVFQNRNFYFRNASGVHKFALQLSD